MRRRDLWMVAGAAALGSRLEGGPGGGAASLQTKIVRLNLRHTWTTVMSSSDYRDTLQVTYTRDSITGHGEGAPIPRYKENAISGEKAIDSIRDYLVSADPRQFSKVMAEVFRRVPGQWAAKAAIDIALMDWVGQ